MTRPRGTVSVARIGLVQGRHLRFALIAIVALLVLPVGARAAGTYTVTRTDDPPSYAGLCTPSDCSLRSAVQSANLDPGSTIVVPGGSYTVNTGGSGSSGELVLSKDVTIAGDDARTTIITATGGGRLFTVTAHAAMSGVTLTGGVGNSDGGGAVLIGGPGARLDLDMTTLRGNKAVASSTSKGGAIFDNGGTLNVSRSTISGNAAGDSSTPLTTANGGGVATTGPTTLTNVTIDGNGVTGLNAGGGGVSTAGASPPLTIVNSTVASNAVAATLSAGGGNLDLGSNAGVLNTIVAGGAGPAGKENCTGPVSSQGHNIESLDQCGFHGSGDKPNTDPQIGPLQDNVGQTDTRAIGAGSPAVDAGALQGCPVTDQRGLPRPQGNGCDIGAFEFLPPRKPGEPPSALVVQPGTGRIIDTFAGAKLKKRRIVVSGKYAIVVLTCPANAPGYCLTNATLFADTSLPRRAHKAKKPVKIGSTTLKIKPGKTANAKVKLSKAALKKLKKKHELKATLLVLSRDQLFTARSKVTPVNLVLKKKKRR